MSEKRASSAKSTTPSAKPMSAGILLYRRSAGGLRVMLAHPGGPYFAKKDAGAWGIPKGLVEPGEEATDAAQREFAEEVGWRPEGALHPLGEVILKSGKRVVAFAVESLDDETATLGRFAPGMYTMEWPPRTGRKAEFPEVDRVTFFTLDEARVAINRAQRPLLDQLAAGHPDEGLPLP